MGAGCSACQNLMGDNLVMCYFGVTSIDTAKALFLRGYAMYGLSEFAEDAWQMQLEFNSGAQKPITAFVPISQDTYNKGYDGLLDGSQFCKEALSIVPLTWANVSTETDSVKTSGLRNLNATAFGTFWLKREMLKSVCGPVSWELVMPEMYHPYNTTIGQKQVEEFISKHPDLPPEGQAVLRSNFLPQILLRYGILGAPPYNLERCVFDNWGNPMPSIGAIWDSLEYDGTYAIGMARGEDIGFTQEPDWTIATWQAGKTWGDPRWSADYLQALYRAIIGENYDTGKSFLSQWAQAYVDFGYINPGQTPVQYLDPQAHAGIENKITTPGYEGDLPYAPPWAVTTGIYHLATTDPKGYGYVDSCAKINDNVVLPLVGAAIAGLLTAAIIPGTRSKLIGGVVVFAAAHVFLQESTGYNANSLWNKGIPPSGGAAAATILGPGIPLTLTQLMIDLNATPAAWKGATDTGLLVVAGVGGYLLLTPALAPFLNVASNVALAVEAPVAAIQNLIEWFADCAGHVDITGFDCMCEYAMTKPGLADALLGPIYGTTDDQYTERMKALEARMTSGVWGSDPYAMGQCDSEGHMSNLIACISAGEWAYQNWPTQFDPTATQYWNEIKDVFDPNNLSFLPPRDVDAPCKTYGDRFRLVNGNCIDQRAPIGKQGPGEYVWPDEYSSGKSPVSACNIM